MLGSVVWRSSKPEVMRRAQVLVTTDCVASRTTDPSVRIVEVDVDTAAYSQGHVPKQIALCERLRRRRTLRHIYSRIRTSVWAADSRRRGGSISRPSSVFSRSGQRCE